MGKTFIHVSLGSLLVIFCAITILTVYDIELVQHSTAQGNIEKCEKSKVENAGFLDSNKDLSGCKLIGI